MQETFLVASVSACQMLRYLHLCADPGVVVSAYDDSETGTMTKHSAALASIDQSASVMHAFRALNSKATTWITGRRWLCP